MSQTKYILSLDQGTTSSRAILFDNEQNIVCVQQREFEQIYPHQGWGSTTLWRSWSSQYGVMNEVIAQSGVDPRDIAGIGITNQRETTILWDKNTARCITPSYGSAAAPRPLWTSCPDPGMADYIRGKHRPCAGRLFSLPPRSSGSWRTSRCGKRPRRGSFCSAWWTHGWSGS